MKSPPFLYARATTVDDALALLTEHGDGARLLAGGQSLLPVLNLRLAAPVVLVDINGIAELRGISRQGNELRIGALARHAEVLASPEVARSAPLLSLAMPHVAHEAVRNRGTFGGSLALADPASEIPAVCVALGAEFELRSPRGTRRVPAHAFFLGTYVTALAPDEILAAAWLPASGDDEHAAFDEMTRRHGDYAIVGTAAQLRRGTDGVAHAVRIAMFGVGPTPLRAAQAARALEGRRLDDGAIADACHALREELDPVGDLHTSAETKRHLAGVQLRRTLQRLAV